MLAACLRLTRTAYEYGSRLTSSLRVAHRYGSPLIGMAYRLRVRLTAHEWFIAITHGSRRAHGYGSRLTSSLWVWFAAYEWLRGMACGLRVAQGYSSRLTSGSLVWLTAYGYGSRLTSSSRVWLTAYKWLIGMACRSRVAHRYGLRLTDTAYGSRIRLTAHEYGLRLTSGLRVARGYGSQLTSSLRVAHGYGSPRSSGSLEHDDAARRRLTQTTDPDNCQLSVATTYIYPTHTTRIRRTPSRLVRRQLRFAFPAHATDEHAQLQETQALDHLNRSRGMHSTPRFCHNLAG
ncbi:hypothetical protein D0859_15217 [Hortaea werneckii]|uniref:Uncharacterized protein n=1 Tax=Hortaea werneckii TaxID=91943 RepID=A0A3M7I645_HORWE|nr:hypothetical protein D0859_15217 [Hortaea werneckii]